MLNVHKSYYHFPLLTYTVSNCTYRKSIGLSPVHPQSLVHLGEDQPVREPVSETGVPLPALLRLVVGQCLRLGPVAQLLGLLLGTVGWRLGSLLGPVGWLPAWAAWPAARPGRLAACVCCLCVCVCVCCFVVLIVFRLCVCVLFVIGCCVGRLLVFCLCVVLFVGYHHVCFVFVC